MMTGRASCLAINPTRDNNRATPRGNTVINHLTLLCSCAHAIAARTNSIATGDQNCAKPAEGVHGKSPPPRTSTTLTPRLSLEQVDRPSGAEKYSRADKARSQQQFSRANDGAVFIVGNHIPCISAGRTGRVPFRTGRGQPSMVMNALCW